MDTDNENEDITEEEDNKEIETIDDVDDEAESVEEEHKLNSDEDEYVDEDFDVLLAKLHVNILKSKMHIGEDNLAKLLENNYYKDEQKRFEALKDSLKCDEGVDHPIAPNYLTYSFNDSRIQERMMKLMNTDVVKLMDRDFMKKLQQRIAEVHKKEMVHRLKLRAKREQNREMIMAMEGILPKEKVHEKVTALFQSMDKILKMPDNISTKQYTQSNVPPPKIEEVDYTPFVTQEDLDTHSTRSDVSDIHSDIPEEDEIELVRQRCIEEVQEEVDNRVIQPQEYEKAVYVADSVKRLRKAKNLEEMYRIADKIYREV